MNGAKYAFIIFQVAALFFSASDCFKEYKATKAKTIKIIYSMRQEHNHL